jgi:hypothetical protein|tara:strand:+ start:746 stop:1036 length:291 start_codon:yes stop_codon:yes gene_type:complete
MTGILGYLPYTIKSDEYAINIIIPRYKKFAKITPKRLSRINVGRKAKVTPRQEQIIFNNIAWIILNLAYFVIGKDPREQDIKTQIIKMKISKLFSA